MILQVRYIPGVCFWSQVGADAFRSSEDGACIEAGCRVSFKRCRVSGFRVWGLGFRVQGLGFRVEVSVVGLLAGVLAALRVLGGR